MQKLELIVGESIELSIRGHAYGVFTTSEILHSGSHGEEIHVLFRQFQEPDPPGLPVYQFSDGDNLNCRYCHQPIPAHTLEMARNAPGEIVEYLCTVCETNTFMRYVPPQP